MKKEESHFGEDAVSILVVMDDALVQYYNLLVGATLDVSQSLL